jgi:hypothetical protein
VSVSVVEELVATMVFLSPLVDLVGGKVLASSLSPE